MSIARRTGSTLLPIVLAAQAYPFGLAQSAVPEQDVLTLERAYIEAQRRPDAADVRASERHPPVEIDADGHPVDARAPVVPILDVRDITVRVFGDIGIAIGTVVGPVQIMRYSRLWLRTDDRWHVLRSQSTRLRSYMSQPTIAVPYARAIDDPAVEPNIPKLQDAEQRRVQAIRAGDRKALERAIGEDFMSITPDGLYKNIVAALAEKHRPGLRLEQLSLDVRGTVGTTSGTQSTPDGAAEFFTRVWAVRLQQWVCVFEHLTAIGASRR